MNKVPRWVFHYVGNKTFDFSSKKKDFVPKTTKFGPKLAFLVNLSQAMQANSMPCCGSVGGCGARAVSRKTPIYFIFVPFHSNRYVLSILIRPEFDLYQTQRTFHCKERGGGLCFAENCDLFCSLLVCLSVATGKVSKNSLPRRHSLR